MEDVVARLEQLQGQVASLEGLQGRVVALEASNAQLEAGGWYFISSKRQ